MKKSVLLLAAVAAVGAQSTVFAAAARLGSPTPAAVSAPAAAGGVVGDPGFEAGTPNPSWAEASTNFGSPLCTAAACGAGGSTQPARTGSWWAWFGGTGLDETSSVSQTITLPSGSAMLAFGFQAPDCVGAATSYIEARINGTAVWRADATGPLCGVTTGYTDQSVNISQYAGQTVTLSFNSFTTGGNTNFFIDDVQVTAVANVPTLSTVGLGALALLLGGLAMRRRFS